MFFRKMFGKLTKVAPRPAYWTGRSRDRHVPPMAGLAMTLFTSMRSYLFLSFHKPSPGGERELWQVGLARLLQERGEAVLVMSNNEMVLKLARGYGLPTREVRWLRSWWHCFRFRFGKLTSETGHFRSQREEQPAVVCWSRRDQLFVTLPARIFGMGVLWGMGEFLPGRWLWRPFGWWHWLMSRLARLFAPSRALAHETYGRLRRPTAVVTLLIDAGEIRLQSWRFRETNPEWTVAVVNELAAPWQTSLMIQTLPELFEVVPLIRLVIIGAGAERQQLLWLAKTLGVESRVSWVTPLPDGAPWFPTCQAVVVSRLDEPIFSHTLARAQLAGVPVLASEGGVHQEYIAPDETGLLFARSNIESLTQKLVQIANRPERTKEMAARAKAEAEKRHASERVWQQWRRLIA